jgi:hypothetical protein
LIAVPLLITRKRSRAVGVEDGEGKGKRGRKQKSDADGIVAARTESECSGASCVMDSILVSLSYIPQRVNTIDKFT